MTTLTLVSSRACATRAFGVPRRQPERSPGFVARECKAVKSLVVVVSVCLLDGPTRPCRTREQTLREWSIVIGSVSLLSPVC